MKGQNDIKYFLRNSSIFRLLVFFFPYFFFPNSISLFRYGYLFLGKKKTTSRPPPLKINNWFANF